MVIDKARIEKEAANFFAWPDPKRKDHVTLFSCCIFAATIAEMAVAAERERCAAVCEALSAKAGRIRSLAGSLEGDTGHECADAICGA